MELNLKRPLLFFDIESTGLSISSDGIIELSFVKVLPGASEPLIKTWKIRPWSYTEGKQIHINEEASKINGVYDDDLKDCPKFIEVLPEVLDWLRGSDLAGFNSAKFDLPLLTEEIERVRAYCNNCLSDRKKSQEARDKAAAMLKAIDSVDLHDCLMVDVQNIYHHMEPRNLRAAYRFYCGGKDFDNAHTAEADTVATYEVLKSQLDRYAEPSEGREEVLKNDVEALSRIGAKPRFVDFAGRLQFGEDGEPVISFGKHKGRTAREVYDSEPSYFAWNEGGDFTQDTKRQFALLKEKFDKERAEAKAALLSRDATSEELERLRDKFSGKLF